MPRSSQTWRWFTLQMRGRYVQAGRVCKRARARKVGKGVRQRQRCHALTWGDGSWAKSQGKHMSAAIITQESLPWPGCALQVSLLPQRHNTPPGSMPNLSRRTPHYPRACKRRWHRPSPRPRGRVQDMSRPMHMLCRRSWMLAWQMGWLVRCSAASLMVLIRCVGGGAALTFGPRPAACSPPHPRPAHRERQQHTFLSLVACDMNVRACERPCKGCGAEATR